MQQFENLSEQLVLDARKRLSMSCVESVDGFNERELILSVNGNKVSVSGGNIKITAFNKSSGNLVADGNFFSVKYNYKKPSLFKRIIK